jgi:LCP family protein required for cell wall assembly
VSQISPRAFLGRFLVAFVLVVVLTTAGIAGAYWQASKKVAQVSKVAIDPAVLQPGGNYLLIGSDSRSFEQNAADARQFGSKDTQTGQRSDTIMVAHINDDGSGFLVSFPRDLWVDIPTIGHAKINAAFNAGPQRIVETIERDFDVPISHYLQVDFSGFRNIVNAMGTIPIYFPAPARDAKSGLSIPKAGCQQLNGDQALAFVRSRYYESLQHGRWVSDPLSDLGRINRQQYFLRTLGQQMIHTAESKPWKAMDLLDSMLANLQRDPKLNFSGVRALAYAFHGGSADLETLTLPTRRQFFDGQDALALDEAKAAPILARLRSQAAPKKTSGSASTNVAPASVKVAVFNGSGRTGLGATAATALRGAGFTVVGNPANASRSDHVETEVQYVPGADAKARTVAAYTGGATKLVAINSAVNGADVQLVIGRAYTGVSSPTTAPKASGSTRKSSTPTTRAAGGLPAAGC